MRTPEEAAAERLRIEREQLALAATTLAENLRRPATKEMLYEQVGLPKTLVRYFADSNKSYFCVVEVDGLNPYRTTTAEERQLGILSLSPPAVQTGTIERLIVAISRAVQTAAFATLEIDPPLGPADLAMIHFRVTKAVRTVLRSFGEDI